MTDFLLSTETTRDPAALERRRNLAAQLDALPDEAFTRLQYLQVQVGCFNRCAFCSQQAGADIWQISAFGLADLVAALAEVTARRGIRLGAGRHGHRPGVLFPYLDNDIASYRHLGQLVAHCADDLGVRLRISTVGYSRRNQHLVDAHRRIVEDHPDTIDGIRFSLTPYAVRYRTNRQEYLADLAAGLRTSRPYLERVGPGAATAAVEQRFAPLVHAVDADLYDEITDDGRHVISVPPHLLVSLRTDATRPEPTHVAAVAGRKATYSQAGDPYLHLISDPILDSGDPAKTARMALGLPRVFRTVIK